MTITSMDIQTEEKILYSNINGNYKITILEDGTKIRIFDDKPDPIYPESLDIKITNYCDMDSICTFCHESSNKKGKHADLNKALNILKELPQGTELAIGGGNPLAHPNLKYFLTELKKYNLIPNITVNQLHINKTTSILLKYLIDEKLIYGLGISVRNINSVDFTNELYSYENLVWHIILGLNSKDDIQKLYNKSNSNNCSKKILMLGYKTFGKGLDHFNLNSNFISNNITETYNSINKIFQNCEDATFAFDNLAIKQLDLERLFSKEKWEELYMGDEGTFTQYIDFVQETFGISSTDDSKNNISEFKDIKEIFKFVKEKALKSL